MRHVSLFDSKGFLAQRLPAFNIWDASAPKLVLEKTEIKSFPELCQKLETKSVDILVFAVYDSASSACEMIREVLDKNPNVQIIAIGKEGDYKTVREFFISGTFDYLLNTFSESEFEQAILRIYEQFGTGYIVKSLAQKIEALISNIFLGGGQESFIISEIIEQIYKDWNNDSIDCQIVAEKTKEYIYQILVERKPWLEKFLYKKDFLCTFGLTLKSKEEIVRSWTVSFKEASIMVAKYQMIDDKLVYKIGKYAVVHVDEKLSLDDVSKGVFLNSSYISHVFKKVTGMNFVDFMTEVKIDRAKVLLRDFDVRVNEVAFTLGYNNQEYFSKIFKKKTGFTPIEYHEMLMQKYSVTFKT